MLPSDCSISILGNLTPVALVTDEGTVAIGVDNSFQIFTEHHTFSYEYLSPF